MDKKDQLVQAFMKAAGDDCSDKRKAKKNKIDWFYNIRPDGGLRLTDFGFKYLTIKAELKSYKIDFPKDFSITPQVLVWLDNFIESPYYITKKSITVFKESSAFELYLFSGDIRKYGYNKALARRLHQDDND
jgi:hypothetical protein